MDTNLQIIKKYAKIHALFAGHPTLTRKNVNLTTKLGFLAQNLQNFCQKCKNFANLDQNLKFKPKFTKFNTKIRKFRAKFIKKDNHAKDIFYKRFALWAYKHYAV